MTVDELRLHFGVKTDTALAIKIGYTKGAVTKWRSKGISPKTQAALQLLTSGKVKANLEALSA